MTDLELLQAAAEEAGALASRLQGKGLCIEKKPDGSPVTNADLAVDAFLKQRLSDVRPDYGWLSEESVDDSSRLAKHRVFIVDPIDGTRSYMRGKPFWAVAAAVVEEGRPIAGVVFAPALGEHFAAEAGRGATLNAEPIRASATFRLEQARMLGDEKMFAHPAWPIPWPPMVIETRNAIAYRLSLVAAGVFDAAIALSAKSEWDLAAAALIAKEAGAWVSDHNGLSLGFNTPSAKVPSVVCCAPGLRTLILERTSPIALRN